MTRNLEDIQKELYELWHKQLELVKEAEEYCKDRKFKIVKPIYYSGFQNNLEGKECYIHPYVSNGELLANCMVYNKRTKKCDIYHSYGYNVLSFYKEKVNE